jgi:hypothetical protein
MCNAKRHEDPISQLESHLHLVTSRELQFESKLLQIGVDFQKDGAFQAQGLTSWPKVSELFLKDLPKEGNGTIA